jgi:putative transposase
MEGLVIGGKRLSITMLCKEEGVSRKGYYNHFKGNSEVDALADAETKASSVLYYCVHVREEMPRAGVAQLYDLSNKYFSGQFKVGRDWLYDLLRANDMLLKVKCHHRPPRTTYGIVNHGFEDHLNTIPKYIAPDHCRMTVSDITYVKTAEGFLYLSLTMDIYSRIITGYDLQRTLTTDGPMNALKQTIDFYKTHGYDVRGLIFHSDRGCQYVSHRMTQYEAEQGIITSVTQTGDPLHNAMAERLNGTIKNDLLYNCEHLSFEETKEALDKSVKLYNTARPHRALGMKTPMQTLIPGYPNPLVEGPGKGAVTHPQGGWGRNHTLSCALCQTEFVR